MRVIKEFEYRGYEEQSWEKDGKSGVTKLITVLDDDDKKVLISVPKDMVFNEYHYSKGQRATFELDMRMSPATTRFGIDDTGRYWNVYFVLASNVPFTSDVKAETQPEGGKEAKKENK